MRSASSSLVFVGCLSVVACSTTRGELDLRASVPPNPTSGPAVRFAPPEDARAFEVAPPQPSIPSLKYDEDIDDPAITQRAIARKRNSFGAAQGDILLPEGRSVPGVVRELLTTAFRDAGFRVLGPDDPGYDAAPEIRARIDQFWAWMTPGFWTIALDVELRLTLDGYGLVDESVEATARVRGSSASSGSWQKVIEAGMDNLIRKLGDLAERARRRATAAPPAS